MNSIEQALSTVLEDAEIAVPLAAVLAHASKTGRISCNEITTIIGDSTEEVLLLGNKWRLLIPIRVERSGAWEDRLLRCKPGESYELPNIIRYLVQNASKTGLWDPMTAIAEVFKEMGEPNWQQMPELVMELGEQSRYYQISAIEIRQICARANLGDKVDVLIAELKAGGVMSPKLGALAEVARAGSPLYELSPSIFIKKGEKK